MRHLLTDLRGNPIFWSSRRLRSSRTLFHLVKNQAWTEVIRRARTHPHEINVLDDNGNTPLHVACQLDPPPDVIRKLRTAASMKNAQGATPLHIAASHRCSAAALQTLIDVASSSLPTTTTTATATSAVVMSSTSNNTSPTAELSRMGRAPIHYACMSFRGLELQAFSVLLEATLKEGTIVVTQDSRYLDDYLDEEDYLAARGEAKKINVLTLRDSTGHTPLGLLFRRYRERVKSVIESIDKLRVEHKDRPDRATLAAAMAVQADLGQLWGKARFVVARLTEERLQREVGAILSDPVSPGDKAISREAAAWATEQHGSDERQFRIVHASVGLTGYGCPPEMIRLAISINPQQVREMDEEGNLVRGM